MSFFNKLKSLPEFYDLADQLDTTTRLCERRMQSYRQVCGPTFIDFARKHPGTVSDLLFELNKPLESAIEMFQSSCQSLAAMKTELQKALGHHEAQNNRTKKLNSLKSQSDKSKAVEERAGKKLESVRMKNDQDLIARCEKDHSICIEQKQSDLAQYEAYVQEYKKETDEYKKSFFTAILGSLEKFASQRKEGTASLVGIGDQLVSLSEKFSSFDDPSITTMKSQLQMIRNENVGS